MKFMNMHISQKHIYLFAIVVGAILLFSVLSGPREGFNNYIATGKTSSDDDNNSNDDNSSYVAPAGNTVLYNMDDQGQDQMQDQMQDQDDAYKPKKKCNNNNKHKNKNKKHNWSRNDGPLGIPRSQIPNGAEDLYILKSEVIPPVCPACPNVSVCANNNKTPPPCPPCARCPEPAFDCKKVPNYNSNNSEYLPRPVLADFSQFGM